MSVVKTLKLDGNVEVICKLEDKGDVYVMHSPLVLSMTPQGFAMIPFMFSSDSDEFEIMKTKVVCVSRPNSEFENKFLEATTGLSLSSGNNSNLNFN